MTKVTVDIDEEVLARMSERVLARNLSVEELLKEQVDGMVRLASFKLENVLSHGQNDGAVRVENPFRTH